MRCHDFFILLIICSAVFARDKCPGVDQENVKGVWEAWNTADLRYFCLDMTNPDLGILAIGFWIDTVEVSLFVLTRQQIGGGSAMLFFQSLARQGTDKVVVSAKGTACESKGTLKADVQMLFQRSIINKNVQVVFTKCPAGDETAFEILQKLSVACRKQIGKVKK